MFNEAESREKWLRRREDADASIAPSVCIAAGTATNPGINDQTAALTPFGSTGTMQMTILSKKYTDALFREPSKQLFLSTSLPKWPKMDEKRP